MRKLIATAAAASTLLGGTALFAQAVDPNITGPARRAAGAAADAAGAPGINNRIERREERRDLRRADDNPNAAARAVDRAANPDRWRMRYYNNEWWYYTPQNSWSYYRNNRWAPFDRLTYRALPRQYSSGYRGTMTGRFDNMPDRFAYGREGAPGMLIGIQNGAFQPNNLTVQAGETITFVNRDNQDHTVTSSNGNFDSGDIAPGASYTARFKTPGTYQFASDHGQNMQGTITVTEASTVPPANNVNPQQGAVDVQGPRGGRVDVNPSNGTIQTAPPASQPPLAPAPAPPRVLQ